MGKRGPAKRPEYLKVLSGTDRDDRPPAELQSAGDQVLTELPETPAWLPNEESKAEWVRVTQLLLDRGQLDPMKLGTLGMYCATHGKIQQMFKGGVMPSAHLMNQYRGFAKDLGISDSGPSKPTGGATPTTNRWQRLKQRSCDP